MKRRHVRMERRYVVVVRGKGQIMDEKQVIVITSKD